MSGGDMTNNMHIRNATPADADEMYRIENEGGGDWKKDFFLNELKNSFAVVLAAEVEGEIVGFAVVWHVADELQLNNIAVSRVCRRQGIGSALLDFIENSPIAKDAKKILLEVREKNETARAFYAAHGFTATGLRKNYYGNDNAVLMEKVLQ